MYSTGQGTRTRIPQYGAYVSHCMGYMCPTVRGTYTTQYEVYMYPTVRGTRIPQYGVQSTGYMYPTVLGKVWAVHLWGTHVLQYGTHVSHSIGDVYHTVWGTCTSQYLLRVSQSTGYVYPNAIGISIYVYLTVQ